MEQVAHFYSNPTTHKNRLIWIWLFKEIHKLLGVLDVNMQKPASLERAVIDRKMEENTEEMLAFACLHLVLPIIYGFLWTIIFI